MRCNNCNAELNEGEKFCAVCGQPVNAEKPDNTAQSVNPGQPEMQMAGSGRKSGKKRFFNNKIIIAAAVVCLLIVGVAAAAVFNKSNLSDAEYYRTVEKKNMDAKAEYLAEFFNSVYGDFTKESFGSKVDMKLTLSDSVKSLAALAGADLSKLDNIALDMAVKKEKSAYSSIIKAGGNGVGLLTLKTHYDMETKDGYMQIPELSEAYVHTSMDDLEGNRLYSYADIGKVIPKAEDLETIYKRYADIVIKSVQNVEKAEEQVECEAEGISCKADLYTVTIEGKEAVSLVGDIFKQLKEDNEIKNIIKNIDEKAGDKYEDEIADAIEEVEKEAEATDFSFVMEVQVDRDDKIIGRNIIMKDGTGEITIRIMCPRDGENFGWEAVAESEGKELFRLHGKGTEKDGMINGDFAADLVIEPENDSLELTKNALVVTVENYDVSKMKEGEVRGTIIYSTETLAELANYSLKIEAERSQKESTGTISILAGKEAIATIDMKAENDVEVAFELPSESDKIYEASDSDDMSAYQSEMDVVQLLRKVQDTLGISLNSLMGLM